MRLLLAFLTVVVAVCRAHPVEVYGDNVYPSYLPQQHTDDDFAHLFRYKEYFPTPHDVGVGTGYPDGKFYGVGHAHPSIGGHVDTKVHYVTSSIGDHLSNKAHAIKSAHSAVSDHIGGKISYVTSGISGHFKGHYDDKGAPVEGSHGQDGYSKLGAVAHGVGASLSAPIAAIKYVQAGISDTISHKAQVVREGISEQLNNAALTIKVAQSDLSDHLSRSAVHVKDGISGTLADSTNTAQTLYGILSEFLGKKVQVIKEGVTKQVKNTEHALSAANAAIFQLIGKKALRVGEFLQNKAHEINVSIQKKLQRDYGPVPPKVIEPIKAELPPKEEKLEELGGPYQSGAIGSSFAVSSRGPDAVDTYDGPYDEEFSLRKPGNLFQPNKVAAAPIPVEQEPPISFVPESHYEATSYTKM